MNFVFVLSTYFLVLLISVGLYYIILIIVTVGDCGEANDDRNREQNSL